MFRFAEAFDQDNTNWVIRGPVEATEMFREATEWLKKYKRIAVSTSNSGPPSACEPI
jgi:hypothetical protein